ncbi:protein SERAC1 isoform X1 [Neodiprion pinetum]|uniref:protein SERAC1 isoform X1 n=1 Tax=Neodiprion pinetum TaxID=441929 RepID=UPI001EE02475|nr:protein SERAC1-like isoform X1 [Neodiprion pinetum]
MQVLHYSMYTKSVYLLRSAGTCIVLVGGCWFCYQLRQTSQILSSVVPTKVLDLEHTQAEYIYVDDPRLQDVLLHRSNNDLNSTIVQEKPGITDTVITWWKSLNRSLAYRFLRIAQNGSLMDRQKAVYSLSYLKHLKDWDYWQIAQMLDARTAVALARMPNVDLRFFLRPPFWRMQHAPYEIIENLRLLLSELDKVCANCHPCLSQFLEKNFGNTQRGRLLFDHDLTAGGLPGPPNLKWDHVLLESCVQTLHHHSSLGEHSKDIANAGGLKVLMEVQKYCENDVNISIMLAKIFSNLSLYNEYLRDIYSLGWIGILARWAQHTDIRLSAPAGRALANLDADENVNQKYPRRIYLLHPLHRTRSSTKLDVVFIHGLLGGVFVTWRQRDSDSLTSGQPESSSLPSGLESMVSMSGEQPQEFLRDLAHDLEISEWKRVGHDFEVILDDFPKNTKRQAHGPFTCKGDDVCMAQEEQDRIHRTQCWPCDWLPSDVPSLRVLGVNYNTNLSMWLPLCPIEGIKATLNERSNELTTKLATAGVGRRPVIWVCHSMGGLLVKKILVQEWKNNDRNHICKNTRGIIFYSTPHRGSHVAALKQTTQMFVWPSVEVQELREGSKQLLELHNDFLKMLDEYPIDIISFSETKSTLVTPLKFPLQFVNPTSSDPGVGEFYEIPQDHLSICKPANRRSFLYQKVVNVIKRHLQPSKTINNIENLYT